MDFYEILENFKMGMIEEIESGGAINTASLLLKFNSLADGLKMEEEHTVLLNQFTNLCNSNLDVDFSSAALVSNLNDEFSGTDAILLDRTKKQYVELSSRLNAGDLSDTLGMISKVINEVPKVPVTQSNGVHMWTVDNYRRFNMRQKVAQAVDTIGTQAGELAGTNTFEVSSHVGARPKCYKDQGKWYTTDGVTHKDRGITVHAESELSIGEPDGLFGFNCTHVKFPVKEGITPKSAYKKIPEDANLTIYEDKQTQKRLENKVREKQTILNSAKKYGDEKQIAIARTKVTKERSKLNSFVKDREYLIKNYKNTIPIKN